MHLRVVGILCTAAALGLAAAPGAHAAEDPGLAVSTPDGPLRPGAPVEVTSGVDLTSLAADENGSFTVTSPAFRHPVKVTLQKNSYGQGEGRLRCGIEPGSYSVDIAAHRKGLTAKQRHTTITVAGGGSYCPHASGSSAATVAATASGGGVAVLALAGFAVARHRRGRTQP
ncbi:hypothetical protein [Streptomyces longisporus]|uniref:Carboxypeptidase regulatory-like domain-containing protein n=1 Tax=Streptomyces longisporus TaxID=1948 RepID=A0ABP6AL55_STRLO